MHRTTRRMLPAVVVTLALATGLAAAATLGSPEATPAPVQLSANAALTTTTSTIGATTTTAGDRSASTTPRSTTSAQPAATRSAGQDTPTQQPPSPAAQSPARTASGPLAGCGTNVGGYRPATEAEFRTAITGAWLLCQPPSFFGTDEAGLEIRADGRWSKLERKSNGVLERTAGWGNEGVWETLDTSFMNGRPTFQLNVRVDGSTGTYSSLPDFGDGSQSSAVTKLELSNYAMVADYVPVAQGTTIVPAPSGPPPAPGDRCDTGGDASLYPATQAEFDAAVTGTWLLCGQPSVFGTNDAGLRISADGRWNKLQRRADGSLLAASGPGDAGTWESIDVSLMNGRALFQLNLRVDGGYDLSSIPAFAVHGNHVSKVRLDNSGSSVADYVPLPPGTPIAAS